MLRRLLYWRAGAVRCWRRESGRVVSALVVCGCSPPRRASVGLLRSGHSAAMSAVLVRVAAARSAWAAGWVGTGVGCCY